MLEIIIAAIALSTVLAMRDHCINRYKIAYYEKKLENRGVDINHVKYMSFMDIWRL